MSTEALARSHADHGHGHAHPGLEFHSHATLQGYLIGFGLSVILTAIPFWLVMTGVLQSKQATSLAITLFAITQILVHMVYFLHMNRSVEGGWSMLALVFTLILVVIALLGSIWVMYHLNINMMPQHDMSQMP